MKRRTTHTEGIPFFATWSSKEVRIIDRLLDEIVVPPGQVLCEEGTTGHEFFLIVDGQASVRCDNREVNTLGPGRYFGEMALLDGGPRSATVISDTEMTLLVLGRREFKGMLDTVPRFSSKMLTAMATRLRLEAKRAMADV